jgi:hypothetical protein
MKLASRGTASLMSALFLASACGGDSVAPGNHTIPMKRPDPGGPVATLAGQLRSAPKSTVSGPVRLALAWYPSLFSEDTSLQPSRPRAIVTEDIDYTGSFPANYRFDVQGPPPSEALSPLGGGLHGKGALGVLLAYRDGNANGLLDTIPADGTAIDHVVGASLEWSASKAYAVIYVEQAQEAATGLKPGFNLVELTGLAGGAVVPLSTPVPLDLSGAPLLDAFICRALWDDSATSHPCGIELGDEPQQESLRVYGSVNIGPDVATVDFSISEESAQVKDAEVTLDGHPIAFIPYQNVYRSTLDTALLAGKPSVELRVVTTEGQEVSRSIPLPGAFALTEPAASARVPSGASLTARWSASAGAQAYNLSLEKYDAHPLASASTSDVEQTFPAQDYTGAATLRAEAVAWPRDNESHGFIEVKRVLQQPLTLGTCEAPAQSSLQAAGALDVHDAAAMMNLQVNQDGQPVTNAEVTLGGRPVSYVQQVGEYRLALTGPWGRPTDGRMDLRIRSAGKELCRTLSIPGDFELTTPAHQATVRSGLPFDVKWTQSPGAQVYNVRVESPYQGLLTSASTNALGFTFEPVTYSGQSILRAEAVSWPQGNERLGWLDVKRVRLQTLFFAQ